MCALENPKYHKYSNILENREKKKLCERTVRFLNFVYLYMVMHFTFMLCAEFIENAKVKQEQHKKGER